MKLRGGHNVYLTGRPSSSVEILPEPEELHLPLWSSRFAFTQLLVQEGQRIHAGEVLARDPANFSVPLLAPRGGTVRLTRHENHVTLEDTAKEPEEPYHPDEDAEHVPQDMGSAGMRRLKLLSLGAWQFFYDAHTLELPDPLGTPSAIIVSTLSLEPFLARGNAQIHKRLSSFTRGLEHLQSLLEYQPIYLVMPETDSPFARKVREILRGYAWVKMVRIPLRYPYDNFRVLARGLGLEKTEQQPVWALRTEGVLAVDRALTTSHPCTVRIVSLGGPKVTVPLHLKAMCGYPISRLLSSRVSGGKWRALEGGALTGVLLDERQVGLSAECLGVTVLEEHEEREFLSFVRPGSDRRSFSRCFLSSLGGVFAERLTTALRGERRPCVSCNYCEEVCPAGIMPHLIHKYLYQDALEEAEQARADLCVACGLCSFVCPSKIDLRQEIVDALVTIQEELHPEVAE